MVYIQSNATIMLLSAGQNNNYKYIDVPESLTLPDT